MRRTLSLRTSYLLLVVLVLVFSVLSFIYEGLWLGVYLSNIAAGLVGSLIIILLVDKIIERNRESERVRIVRIALKRLATPLMLHVRLLAGIYKASTKSKPASLPTTFDDLFNDEYYNEISFLDFSKKAPVIPERDWFTFLHDEMKSLREKMEQIIDTYAVFLDFALLDILERVANSAFLSYVIQSKGTPEIDRRYGWKRIYTMFRGVERLLRDHISYMKELIDYFNSESEPYNSIYSPIPLTNIIQDVWRNDVAPQWGSSRVDTTQKP